MPAILKPWREVAIPHTDVLSGTFQQAEFAAHLYRVHEGTATPDYQNPVNFFALTFITEGMGLLLRNVVRRLVGQGGDPVIQLQTAFGGGKTHTMLAVYHLVKRQDGRIPAGDLAGIGPLLDELKITDLPAARVAVLDGGHLSVNKPREKDGLTTNTLWGELARQLGGREAYELVRAADESGTAPGSADLTDLLQRYSPCVILIDELVVYMRQFRDGRRFTGGDYNANLSFIQNLTEALKAVPTAQLLASLPESDREAGDDFGVSTLHALEHVFARIQALWKPVASSESFEIVRRRLFKAIHDEQTADAVCHAYAQYYTEHPDLFPEEVRQGAYYQRLRQTYPIHPEVFERLYKDWSAIHSFQRTRGVLKLMAQVISRLWAADNKDLLIQPGNIPLADSTVRGNFVQHLDAGWDPVVERDIDGPLSEPFALDQHDTRFGAAQAARRVARTVFLGSAPAAGKQEKQQLRGLTTEQVLLGSATPGQSPAVYADALRRLTEKLQYLSLANNRYWFDTRPNLRREMEERKRRFDEAEHLLPHLARKLSTKIIGSRFDPFDKVHVFTADQDIPDDDLLRLIVLPLSAPFQQHASSPAIGAAQRILEQRGTQPRVRRNRLIFLAPELDALTRLRDQLRTVLAWESILKSIELLELNLDSLQKQQASQASRDADKTLDRTLREAYKWVLVPSQDARPGSTPSAIRWEQFNLPTNSTANLTQDIEEQLVSEGVLLKKWAPLLLAKELDKWFWQGETSSIEVQKVWDDFSRYLYLPRIKSSAILNTTIQDGLETRDFFALTQTQNGEEYGGFVFGAKAPVFSTSILLSIAAAQRIEAEKIARRAAEEAAKAGASTSDENGNDDDSAPGIEPAKVEENGKPSYQKQGGVTKYIGSARLNALKSRTQFEEIYDEIIAVLTQNPNATIELSLDIKASSPTVFDDKLIRTLRENSAALRFTSQQFE
jgi:predicted AAA+ superfamily ATPase